ncbi:MAG TPA: response regulator [Nitrososphaeraceae archaeon]|nr:response regulator [Nitrososphaeraceae archaeon]
MNLTPEFIAVIDDEEDIVKLFTDVIQINGYFVMGFTNPLFLIDYTREFPDRIGLILIDYRMPEMTGCELATQIVAINPKIKMVLITAYDDILNNALNLEIVKKPITISKILEIVNQYMNGTVI